MNERNVGFRKANERKWDEVRMEIEEGGEEVQGYMVCTHRVTFVLVPVERDHAI